MALVTANNISVISGIISMPLSGIWSADLVIDKNDASNFEEGTKITISSQGTNFVGTVVKGRSGDFLEAVHIKVIGGAAGMSNSSAPRSYVQPHAFVRDVLGGLTKDSGETLDSTTDSSFLSTNITAWAVTKVPVSRALTYLIELIDPTMSWRILLNGNLWVGNESWPNLDGQFFIMEQNPANKTTVLGVEYPFVYPGVTLNGVGRVERVEHQISHTEIRTKVWTEILTEERGIKEAIIAIAQQAIAGIDYYALYDAKVVSQSSDGTKVDVQPLDSRLPGMSSVPLCPGIPGTTMKVASGSFLRVGWSGGNPTLPYAAIWNGNETVTRISIAGDTDAARKGDDVNGGTVTGMAPPGGGAVLFTYTPYGGEPGSPSATLVLNGGQITGGSSKIGLG